MDDNPHEAANVQQRFHLHLTKHHGLGNDFLVLIDLDETTPIDAAMARSVCDRRTGVGADGLIRVTPGHDDADFAMELLNSDGSPAEMSGNGMRCLVQAVVMSGHAPGDEFVVLTAGGARRAVHSVGDQPGQSRVSVEMGPATPGQIDAAALVHKTPPLAAATIDIGNPHLVLHVEDPGVVDLSVDGPAYEAQFPEGANVHWIRPVGEGLELRVWERGAGITMACGTGACAAATAAHRWGLVPADVTVLMPGGAVEVSVRDDVLLTGPANYVASIDVDPSLLVSR
ncbi:MAG: diaminopimelate epimerase [Acidimicrobiales bacterium]